MLQLCHPHPPLEALARARARIRPSGRTRYAFPAACRALNSAMRTASRICAARAHASGPCTPLRPPLRSASPHPRARLRVARLQRRRCLQHGHRLRKAPERVQRQPLRRARSARAAVRECWLPPNQPPGGPPAARQRRRSGGARRQARQACLAEQALDVRRVQRQRRVGVPQRLRPARATQPGAPLDPRPSQEHSRPPRARSRLRLARRCSARSGTEECGAAL